VINFVHIPIKDCYEDQLGAACNHDCIVIEIAMK